MINTHFHKTEAGNFLFYKANHKCERKRKGRLCLFNHQQARTTCSKQNVECPLQIVPRKNSHLRKKKKLSKKLSRKIKAQFANRKYWLNSTRKSIEMACRIALRAVFLTEPWLPFPFFNKLSTFTPIKKITTPNLSCGCKTALNSKSYQFSSNCSNKGDSSPSSDDSEQGPPQEAVLKAISGLSFFCTTFIFDQCRAFCVVRNYCLCQSCYGSTMEWSVR